MILRSPRLRLLLVLPPLVLGVVLIMAMGSGRQPPVRAQSTAPPTPVRVLEVPRSTVVPRVVAYGVVQPDRVWQGVAEVSGRLIEVSPLLRRGAIVPEGTPLVRIDPSDYRLTLAQRKAQKQDLEAQKRNLEASLAIEDGSLDLARRDLSRKETLAARGAVSTAALDEARRTALSTEQTVQNLRNSLNLIPAQMAQVEAQISQAELDLARTTLSAPFDLRVAEAGVTEGRYAQRGEVLVEGDSIAKAEVEAQVPLDRMLAIAEGAAALPGGLAGGAGEGPAGDQTSALGSASRHIHEALGLSASVRLRAGEREVAWTGRVERISDTVDPRTRTIGVIVVVEEPYRHVEPGVRPPLVKNMFVEVLLTGAARADRVVVPRQALHDGAVFLVTGDGTLERRPVTLGYAQDGFAVVTDGLAGGETLVLSDLVPAVVGMALDPRPDDAARDRLIAEAGGEAAK